METKTPNNIKFTQERVKRFMSILEFCQQEKTPVQVMAFTNKDRTVTGKTLSTLCFAEYLEKTFKPTRKNEQSRYKTIRIPDMDEMIAQFAINFNKKQKTKVGDKVHETLKLNRYPWLSYEIEINGLVSNVQKEENTAHNARQTTRQRVHVGISPIYDNA